MEFRDADEAVEEATEDRRFLGGSGRPRPRLPLLPPPGGLLLRGDSAQRLLPGERVRGDGDLRLLGDLEPRLLNEGDLRLREIGDLDLRLWGVLDRRLRAEPDLPRLGEEDLRRRLGDEDLRLCGDFLRVRDDDLRCLL